MSRAWLRLRLAAARLFNDSRGIAATEFAVIVPIMLVMFFGTVEFSSGVAVDRKVTLVARTLSDLTARSVATMDDSFLQNIFTASIAILTPYSPTPVTATISEIYIDASSKATIQWSKAATIASGATQATLTASTFSPTNDVTTLVPPTLLIPKTFLIWSQVSYLYKPTIGYVMTKAGVTLSDVAYTRPRSVVCVVYNSKPDPCPTN
jgi:Flp pilus assembly protein TadG